MAQEQANPTPSTEGAKAAPAEGTTDPKAQGSAATPAQATATAADSASAAPDATRAAASSADDPAPTRKDYLALAQEKAARVRAEREAKAAAEQAAEAAKYRERLKADPLAVLTEEGLTYEQLTERILSQGREPTAEEQMAAELAALKEWRAEQEKKAQEAAEARERAAAEQVQAQALAVVKQALEAGGDDFQIIRALGHEPQVYEELSEYAKLHEIPPGEVTFDHLRAVAKEYERELEEQYGSLYSKAPKLAARLAPPKQETATAQPGTNASGAQGTSSVTLASKAISEAPPPQPGRRLTIEELRAKALSVYKGEATA